MPKKKAELLSHFPNTVSGMDENNSNTNHTGTRPNNYRTALLVLYVLIFVGGILNVVLMSCMLRSQRSLSFTNVSVINLIAVHLIFLLTVPFRIVYYATDTWSLGIAFCKFVSLMIHAHMYLAFIFYVFLLIVRYVENFGQQRNLGFHRTLYAALASAAVWFVIFGSMTPPAMLKYGQSANNLTQCFNFAEALKDVAVKNLNYAICTLVLLVWSVLVFFQIYFLIHVSRKLGKDKCKYQEFWAQLKNVVFLLVMFLFFVPYQAFRIYYMSNYGDPEIQYKNEIFLAFTAFSCFDMIFFAGRDIYKRINSGECVCCL